MKTSSACEFYQDMAAASFKSLSEGDIEALLQPFYLGLGFDARRTRFGCATSDDAILRYCRELASKDCMLFGGIEPTGLVAVVELHPHAHSAELAFASVAKSERVLIYAHLLQLAAFAAGRRGYRELLVSIELIEPEVLDLLRSMGQVGICEGTARVDLGEYARLHGFAVER
jgi:hypothetical protein